MPPDENWLSPTRTSVSLAENTGSKIWRAVHDGQQPLPDCLKRHSMQLALPLYLLTYSIWGVLLGERRNPFLMSFITSSVWHFLLLFLLAMSDNHISPKLKLVFIFLVLLWLFQLSGSRILLLMRIDAFMLLPSLFAHALLVPPAGRPDSVPDVSTFCQSK